MVPSPPPPSPEQKLLIAVRGAQSEIVAFVPCMAHKTLAQELRGALRERGVKVHLLIPAQNYWDKGSYTGWLSAQGVAVYARANLSGEAFMVIDKRYIFIGSGIGQPNLISGPGLRLSERGSELTRRYNWLASTLEFLKPIQIKQKLGELRQLQP